jgi:hypothetical protein
MFWPSHYILVDSIWLGLAGHSWQLPPTTYTAAMIPHGGNDTKFSFNRSYEM